MTVGDLVTEVLRELNVISANETAPNQYLARGLNRFNLMMDLFKAQFIMIYELKRQIVATVANQASYTIGTGGNWNIARPEQILRMGFVNTAVNPTEPLETPMRIYTDEEWAAVGLKSLTNTIAWGAWYQTSYPLGVIYVYPVQTVAAQVALYVPTPMDEAAALTTALYLPPGYRAVIIYGLAQDMATMFERAVSADISAKYKRALTIVQRANAKPITLRLPSQLTWRADSSGYNILTNQGN